MPFPLIPVLVGGLGYTVYKLITPNKAPTLPSTPTPSPSYATETGSTPYYDSSQAQPQSDPGAYANSSGGSGTTSGSPTPASVSTGSPSQPIPTSAPATTGASAGTIRSGSSGDTVKAWQQMLGITADGKMGPQTIAATKAFQASHGLKADGIVGPQTWAAVGVTGTGKAVGSGTVIPHADTSGVKAATQAAGASAANAASAAQAARASANQAAGTNAAILSINPNPKPVTPTTKPKVVVPHGEFAGEQARVYAIYEIRHKNASNDAQFAGWFPTIVWSGDVYDYLDSTNKQVLALDNDIIGASLPQDFLSSWEFYKGDWAKFYQIQKDASHTFDSADIMNQIDVYVEKLKSYQAKMQSLGAAKNVPAITTDPNSTFAIPETSITGSLGSNAKMIGIGAGIAVVGVLAIKIASLANPMTYIPRR